MDFIAIDVITQMVDSILVQYKESPNILSYMTVLLEPLQELEDVFTDIMNLRMLENAENAQIDTNGEIVVIPRGVYDSGTITFFGLNAGDVNAPVAHEGLGDVNNPLIGGLFRSIEQPIASRAYIDDAYYRLAIKAKARKNSFKGGVENLLNVITGLIPFETGETVQIEEDFSTPSDPFVLIKFNKVLDAKQKSFFTFYDVLPRGGGIRYEYEDLNGTL